MTDILEGDPVLRQIKSELGDAGWKSPKDAAGYFEDPRGRFTGQGRLIAMPANVQEVARVVKLCGQAGIGVVPYGGGTGVVAAQLSIKDSNVVILSLERMNAVREISVDDGTLTAEAGCILEDIHLAADTHGLIFPLTMASKGSCRIGGVLATNAGGIQVLRHGNARDLCLGIEAVLPNGDILNDLSPLRKNNTGYDLRHLLIGSEGTLGIITAASLVLKPAPSETATSLCAIVSPDGAAEIHRRLQQHLGDAIDAMELISGFGVRVVTSHFAQLKAPFPAPDWVLLAEVSGPTGISTRFEQVLSDCLEDGLITDAAIAKSESQRKNLWNLREFMPEANKAEGAICSSDTAVPKGRVGAFIDQTHRSLAAMNIGLRVNSYGHIGDGNIHHNVFGPTGETKADFTAKHPEIPDQVRDLINRVTLEHGGTISAEHGIGRLKVLDLETYGGRSKITALRAIKSALDPQNIMNPGAVLRV